MNDALRQGLGLIENGQYEAAHGAAIALIHANTQDPVAYFLLGKIALDHDNYAKAGELFTKAKDLGPTNPLFVASLGQYLVTTGRNEQALVYAEAAANLPINSALVADTIGVIYSRVGFHEKAVPFFEKAVALNPKPGNFHYNLGASLQFSGEFSRAELAYKEAIARQPDNYRAYSSLVGLTRQTKDTHWMKTLERLYIQTEQDPDAALNLGHAMAKTLEDLGDYRASYSWLERAKQRKRQVLNYEIDNDLSLFAAAAATARAPETQSPVGAGPIFIIGLPRTGTTLVDRIISSHPEVTSAGELNTFADLIKTLSGTRSPVVLDEATLKEAANASDAGLAEVGQRYLARTVELARGAHRFTDKMPLNFFYAGLICRALPNARIVAVRRGAMDSCLSNFRQLFSTGFSYYNYSLDIADTARYYKNFDQLMTQWRRRLPAQNFLEVRYEDIVHDQERQTRNLLNFCQLSWFDGCLNFHENPSPVSTASSVQVRQPLYSGAIGRWKKYGETLDPLYQQLSDAGLIDSSGT